MSYDVYFVIDTGSGNTAEIDSRNYTSNVSCMWTKALDLPEKPYMRDGVQVIGSAYNRDTGEWYDSPCYDRGVRLLHNAPASEAAGVLAAAVERMESNPDEYRPMEPDNGWGDYGGALDFLRWMAETAREHPASRIVVSS